MTFKKQVQHRYTIVAAPVNKISPQEAINRGYFGPVYHGTNEYNREKIEKDGFKVFIGNPRSENVTHGYELSNYWDGKPAPIHHLGFGVYLTTVKAIGKKFNNNSLKGLKSYYIDAPRIETINFGSPRNMMKWWVENGYDMPQVSNFADPKVVSQRLKATKNMTNHLKSNYDAVWFKGKGITTLLDGDQIVVFDPKRIYEVDQKLATGLEIGGKVKRKSDGMVGIIRNIRDIPSDARQYHPQDATKFFQIKWKKGGTDLNVYNTDIEPLS